MAAGYNKAQTLNLTIQDPGKDAAQAYLDWISKFEAPKTSDSTFTPPAVYDAVKSWAVHEYALQGRVIARPFYPGGDYIRQDYPAGCVVIDNPPFSILAQIVRFYALQKIPYFLFAPALTLFGLNSPTSVVVNAQIVFANGASVSTSFVTNLDRRYAVRSAPELKRAIESAIEAQKPRRDLPVYSYPPNIITSARLGKIAAADWGIPHDHVSGKISKLASQNKVGKGIFGGGFMVSNAAAAAIEAAAIKAAAIKAARARMVWDLNRSEQEIIDLLNKQEYAGKPWQQQPLEPIIDGLQPWADDLDCSA